MEIKFLTNERYKEVIPEPQPAANVFPEWFGKMKVPGKKCPLGFASRDNPFDIQYRKNVDPSSNITGCPGIADFLKYGYVIPAWDNFVFREYEGDLVINWTDNVFRSKMAFHGTNQYPTMPKESHPLYSFIKIQSPWVVKTSPGVSIMITHPVWHRNKNFTSSTGILHTDASPFAIPWFFEWNYKPKSGIDLDGMDTENQIVERGTPLMLIIPFYRNNYESVVEYVSDSEFDRLEKVQNIRTNSISNNDVYSKLRKTIGKLFR